MKNFQKFIILGLCFVANSFAILPIIQIDTKDSTPILSRVDYVPMQFTLTDPNNSKNNVSLVAKDFSDGGIRLRGNSTRLFPKKPYRVKFNKKISLFGIEKAKNWILLAEYLDPTFLFTPTAFHLGDIFQIPFNHSYHHVQLYLNGEYLGIYGLTEHNQVGKGRVDINETEGWFVEIDKYYDEDPKFRTINYNLPVMIKSPDFGTNSDDLKYNFIKNGLNELCDSMASENFPENGYRNLINMNTFVDYLMVNEIINNGELMHPKSLYLYKDKHGKISLGPLWDFDWGYGSIELNEIHTFFNSYTGRLSKHAFLNRFFDDPIFLAKYKKRWNEKYNEVLNVTRFIDELSKEIETYFTEDYERWNYLEKIEKLKTWWNNRVFWLNTELKIHIQFLDKSIVLKNLPKNTKVEIYNLQGKRIYSTHSGNSEILKILVQTKGIYVLKIGSQFSHQICL